MKRVSVPYEITLLSNYTTWSFRHTTVSVPYEITLLSNGKGRTIGGTRVSVPYEITLLSNGWFNACGMPEFQYLMKLHYSQTYKEIERA